MNKELINKELAEEYFHETGVHLCHDLAFEDYIVWLQKKYLQTRKDYLYHIDYCQFKCEAIS